MCAVVYLCECTLDAFVYLPIGVCAHVCIQSCAATEMRDYLDFPSGIFSRVSEKYY